MPFRAEQEYYKDCLQVGNLGPDSHSYPKTSLMITFGFKVKIQ